jgi:hypothetical protein
MLENDVAVVEDGILVTQDDVVVVLSVTAVSLEAFGAADRGRFRLWEDKFVCP